MLCSHNTKGGHISRHLSEEIDLDDSTRLQWRHSIQGLALADWREVPPFAEGKRRERLEKSQSRPPNPLQDEETEGDEMFENAGAKGDLSSRSLRDRHQDLADPPRCRANKRRGRGTKDNGHPPILGIVGRRSQQLRLRVCQNTQPVTIQPQIENTTLYTDEFDADNLVLAKVKIKKCYLTIRT